MRLPSPKELDDQTLIKIDKWLDIDSQECRDLDDNFAFTKKCLTLGFQHPAYLALDNLGRVWGYSEETKRYYPFHFEHGKKLIGYRIAKKAAN